MGLSAPPAAVVLDSLAAPLDDGLDAAVGPGAVQRLRAELRAIARRWAAGIAPGRAYEATSADAALLALEGHIGPVVLVAPDIPALSAVHAETALGDLRDGVGLVVGSGHDARPFLVAVARTDPELVALAPGPLEQLFGAAAERGLMISMVRHERRLATAADARALALDPIAPESLARSLGWLRPSVRPD